MQKIPVTVVTGFLGAGKTTLIRHLLENNQGRRIAVIVNEFGEVGIDGDLLRSCQVCSESEVEAGDRFANTIVELTNGCLCCTVQEEFLPTMQELLQRRDQLDCIFIETSGLALPKPLVQAFRWPEIRTGATVAGVITIVDCAALAAGQFVGDMAALTAQQEADPSLEHETPLEELFEDQLACADLVLLTKTDRVSPEQRHLVQQWLQAQLPPGVKIVPCQQGVVAPEILWGLPGGVEDFLDQRPSHHDSEEEHTHDDAMQAIHLQLDRAFPAEQLVTMLQNMVQDQEIYRIKGFVQVPSKPMRLVLQGVGNRFDYYFDRPWQRNEPRQTKLVMIGKNLDRQAIENTLLQVGHTVCDILSR